LQAHFLNFRSEIYETGAFKVDEISDLKLVLNQFYFKEISIILVKKDFWK